MNSVEGVTQIAGIDESGREVLKQKLFTPGELLRQNQLAPDPAAIAAMEKDRQLDMFQLAAR